MMEKPLIPLTAADKPILPLLIITMADWIDNSAYLSPSILLTLVYDDAMSDPSMAALFGLIDPYVKDQDYEWKPHTTHDVPDTMIDDMMEQVEEQTGMVMDDMKFYRHLLALNVYNDRLATELKDMLND